MVTFLQGIVSGTACHWSEVDLHKSLSVRSPRTGRGATVPRQGALSKRVDLTCYGRRVCPRRGGRYYVLFSLDTDTVESETSPGTFRRAAPTHSGILVFLPVRTLLSRGEMSCVGVEEVI